MRDFRLRVREGERPREPKHFREAPGVRARVDARTPELTAHLHCKTKREALLAEKMLLLA